MRGVLWEKASTHAAGVGVRVDGLWTLAALAVELLWIDC